MFWYLDLLGNILWIFWSILKVLEPGDEHPTNYNIWENLRNFSIYQDDHLVVNIWNHKAAWIQCTRRLLHSLASMLRKKLILVGIQQLNVFLQYSKSIWNTNKNQKCKTVLTHEEKFLWIRELSIVLKILKVDMGPYIVIHLWN